MTVQIGFDIEDDRWNSINIENIAERACTSALRHLDIDAAACELSLLACDDVRIAALNADFRNKPQPTNVLSWPSEERGAKFPGQPPNAPTPDIFGTIELGDIAISFDTCLQEAEKEGKTVVDHVTHLIVHGLLHLLGYDHIRDTDATLMEGLEREILGKLGIQDPYRDE